MPIYSALFVSQSLQALVRSSYNDGKDFSWMVHNLPSDPSHSLNICQDLS